MPARRRLGRRAGGRIGDRDPGVVGGGRRAVDVRCRAPLQRRLGSRSGGGSTSAIRPTTRSQTRTSSRWTSAALCGAAGQAVGVGRRDDRRLVERGEQAQPARRRRGGPPAWRLPGTPAARATQQSVPAVAKEPAHGVGELGAGQVGPGQRLGGVAERGRELLEGLHAHRAVQRTGRGEADERGDRRLVLDDLQLGERKRRHDLVQLAGHDTQSAYPAARCPCTSGRPSGMPHGRRLPTCPDRAPVRPLPSRARDGCDRRSARTGARASTRAEPETRARRARHAGGRRRARGGDRRVRRASSPTSTSRSAPSAASPASSSASRWPASASASTSSSARSSPPSPCASCRPSSAPRSAGSRPAAPGGARDAARGRAAARRQRRLDLRRARRARPARAPARASARCGCATGRRRGRRARRPPARARPTASPASCSAR